MNCNSIIRRQGRSNGRAYSFRKLAPISFIICLLTASLVGYPTAKAEVEIEVSPVIAKSQVISRTDSTQSISVVLVLPLKDPVGAAEFVQHVSTPMDKLYGKYLTPQQFADRFGASESGYLAAKNWAKQNGLTISQESISRTTLTVTGTVSQFERAFNVEMNDYRSPAGDKFYAASARPTVPKELSSILMSVVGLSGVPMHAPSAKIVKSLGEQPSGGVTDVIFNGGSGPRGGFTAADIRGAYAIPGYLGSTTPQTVALFEISDFYPDEIATYITRNKLPNVQVTSRPVTQYGGEILYPYELQTVLDIDMVIGTNPALKEVLVYEDGGLDLLVDVMKVLSAVADDNQAQTLDISWFIQESYLTKSQLKAEAQAFTQLAAQGITVVVAAGDGEAIYNNLGANYINDPATQPMVTAVGGTALSIGNQGHFASSYVTEEVWNTVLADVDYTTGGGPSSFWKIPSWQIPANPAYNFGSSVYRNVPDVAAVASPGTPVTIYLRGYGWTLVGGTGVASGIWAGFISILNAARETTGLGKIGFFNPILYNLSGLNDVLSGNNGDPLPPYNFYGYNAGPGYDDCTGWGSMYGTYLAAELLLTPTQQGTAPGPFGGLSGKSGRTTANLTWAPSAGATGYLVIVIAPGDGPLFWDYISNEPQVKVTGLVPGYIYKATVTALNSSGATDCDTVIYLDPQ